MQRAFYVHLRLLWGLLSRTAVPSPPEPSMIATFEQRFGTWDEIVQARNKYRQPITNVDMISRINKLRGDPANPSTIAKQVQRVPETALRYILGLLSQFGLSAWRPNFTESPYSSYNSAHRFIAIDTFRQAVLASAYKSMGVETIYLDNVWLQTLAHDHFVCNVICKVYTREKKYPGITELTAKRDAQLARRRTVSGALFSSLRLTVSCRSPIPAGLTSRTPVSPSASLISSRTTTAHRTMRKAVQPSRARRRRSRSTGFRRRLAARRR